MELGIPQRSQTTPPFASTALQCRLMLFRGCVLSLCSLKPIFFSALTSSSMILASSIATKQMSFDCSTRLVMMSPFASPTCFPYPDEDITSALQVRCARRNIVSHGCTELNLAVQNVRAPQEKLVVECRSVDDMTEPVVIFICRELCR